jgi:hypothetical protein
MNENLNLFLQPKSEVAVIPLENKSLLTANRSELSVMVSRVLEGVDDGNADPLDVFIFAKKGSKVFDAILEGLKDKVDLQGETAKHNCDLREQQTGVRYEYKGCGDPEWDDLNAQVQSLQLRLKARELFLKGLKGANEIDEIIDEETGELVYPAVTVYPPLKTGGTSIIVTVK